MANIPWIVSTKFHIPEPPEQLVSRRRLHDFLDEGAHRKLTLVCAPAGSGKTTLLSEWIRLKQEAIAWVSLDEYDNVMHRFWGHVIAAINATHKHILDRMKPSLRNVESGSFQTLLFPLINELNREPHRRLIIVLDDYHLIHDAEIHRSFAYFVERMPQHVHCVVATRHEPPLPLPRLAVRGQLVRLTGLQLNFTMQEGLDYCRLWLKNLSDAHISQLISLTEGWIAGIKLALLSWRDQQDDRRLLHLISNRNLDIADYLFQEVYDQLSPEIRQFLLHSSIVRELCGPLCEAVTGQAGAGNQLERLVRANLFVSGLDREGVWFRYHHLFAEFLRRQLEQSEPAIVPILHKRAAKWLANSGLASEAVEHYLLGGHYEEAMDVIGKLLPEMVDKYWETLYRWMSQIPESDLERKPELYFSYVFFSAAAKCDRNRIEGLLDRADQLIAAGKGLWPAHKMNEYRSSCHLIKALYATDYLGDIDLTIQHMQACVSIAPEGIPLQEIEINHGEMSILRAFRENYSRLPELERFLQAMIDLWRREEPYGLTGFFMVGYGELCWERDDLTQGERWASEGYRIAMRNRSGKLLAPGAVALSTIYYAQGREQEAHKMLDVTDRCLKEWGFGYWAYLLQAQRIRLYLLASPDISSDLQNTIHRWVEENAQLAEEEITSSQLFTAISLVRGWLALDRLQEAAAYSEKLEQEARRMRRAGELQEILILRAICCFRQNQIKAADAILEEVLTVAEQSGSIRPFHDEMPDIVQLLEGYVVRNSNVSPFVVQLAERFRRPLETAAPGSLNMLTAKEKEVLELLITGMPNRLIAQRLGVSVGTVKTHNNRIYQKLMVKDRWGAIERARAEWGI